MISQWIEISLVEPLIIGSARAGSNFLTSASYLPGKTVRGAWVEWMKVQGKEKDIVGLVEQIQVGNFFPSPRWGGLKSANPLPLSVLTCKDTPGFKSEPVPGRRGHGLVDTLLPQLAYHLLGCAGAPTEPFELICQQCGARMERAQGYYANYTHNSQTNYILVRDRYHAQTKVGINRSRRTAQEGMLYTITALSPYLQTPDSNKDSTGRIYTGRVSGDPSLISQLVQALNDCPIGSLSSRGYGKVTAKVIPTLDPVPVETRLRTFNQRLGRLWQDLRALFPTVKEPRPDPRALYFSVDLLAPGVFRSQGLSCLIPRLPVLGHILEPVFWQARPDHAGGWSPAWGMPKTTQLAAQAGSVYVFAWHGSENDLVKALRLLEDEGIGQRCDEGYGQCVVCHPLHLEESDL